ncbi:MAG: glycosyltransferase family 2 protein [Candidatus Yonathbacteria bacterium]|nr:glycosyltransferase family 2 protein [Candidatus Yonathbacteria bacterium]
MNKIPCSIGILTFNSALSLRACIESVREFDDIVICDGGSTDDTVAIANDYGCRVIYQDQCFKNPNNTIADFSGVRNQQLDATRFDWFMFVDSDEYISRELAEEIREVVAKDLSQPSIFMVPRKYVKDKRIIDCATTYPNYQTRFFNKKAVSGFTRSLHEKIEPKEGFEISKLKNCEYVPLESSQALKKRWNRYLEIERNKEGKENFMRWFYSGFMYHMAVSTLYCLRYIGNLFFCKGNKMPFSYEVLRLWYNFEVIKIGFHRVFNNSFLKKQR